MALVPTLLDRGYKMERLSAVDAYGHKVAGMDVSSIRTRLKGRFISLARADLAAAVFEVCDGIPAHFGASIAGAQQDPDGMTATLSNLRQEQFDLVVGADGLHSQVRELTFGPEEHFETPLGVLRRAFGDMGGARHPGPDGQGRRHLLRSRQPDHLARWTTGRVALIGDAAACASLLAGEGTGLAMVEAYVLAGELHRAGGNIERAFAAFEADCARS
jgi:2-polyprenyl-6-methoxyphenol hydroxylase-like FAD-dependent oxidoreductase